MKHKLKPFTVTESRVSRVIVKRERVQPAVVTLLGDLLGDHTGRHDELATHESNPVMAPFHRRIACRFHRWRPVDWAYIEQFDVAQGSVDIACMFSIIVQKAPEPLPATKHGLQSQMGDRKVDDERRVGSPLCPCRPHPSSGLVPYASGDIASGDPWFGYQWGAGDRQRRRRSSKFFEAPRDAASARR